MIISAILFGIVVPISVNAGNAPKLITKPYMVQAVIDSARLIGLPPSKAAKAYALKVQMGDPVIEQISYVPELVSSRKLFFRSYFQGG